MSAWARAVGDGPGVFLERISGGDHEEVTSKEAKGGGEDVEGAKKGAEWR